MRQRAVISAALLAFAVGTRPVGAARAASAADGAQTSAPVHFDIPRQPLSSALEAFVTATHIQVLSDRPVGTEPWSNGVSGTLAPAAALQALVVGTGLVVHFTGPGAAVLEPANASAATGPVADPQFAHASVLALGDIQVRAEPEFGSLPSNGLGYRLYGYRVRQAVWAALHQDPQTARSAYRVGANLWLDPGGHVEQMELFLSSGAPALDAEIARVLRATCAGQPPPKDMPEPIRIVIDNRRTQ